MIEFLPVGGILVDYHSRNTVKRWMCAVLALFLAAASVYSLAASDMGGRAVTVFDGKHKKVVRTRAEAYTDVLREAGVSLGKYDTYWASTEQPAEGAVVVVERAVPVYISEDGKKRKIYTAQQTVQGAVHDAGYDWQTMMPVEDSLGKIRKNMVIHVVPYTKQVKVRTETLPVHFVRWYDDALAAGEEQVVDPGRPASRTVTVEEYVSEDGQVLRSDVVKTEIVDSGADGALRVGEADGTAGRVLRMKATAYHPSDGDGRGITATGTVAGRGTVAVDPDVIPLGAYVYIPGYGDAVAADTGGAILGNRIDLCMETFSECYDFGVRPVEVFVAH